MKDRIIYRNRIEMKILSIAITLIWSTLYAIITVSDLQIQSPHFWHNQKCLLITAFVFSIPLFIIGRFKIMFDYKNRQINHVPYLKSKRKYHFDDVCISIERGKTHFLTWNFVFSKDNKRLFSISDVDFEGQTHESADHLKEFLQGDAGFIYNIERRMKQEGYHFTPYGYALCEAFGSVRSKEWSHWITIKYRAEENSFTLQVWKIELHKEKGPKEYILEEQTSDADALIQSILELAYRYL